jgi:hypothetical protein
LNIKLFSTIPVGQWFVKLGGAEEKDSFDRPYEGQEQHYQYDYYYEDY